MRNTARAFPTLLRVGFSDAVAYRAEMLVWVLATTMPLVMLALWATVAREAPMGRYGEPQFVAYFLATFIVRQITGSWIYYEMNFDVRNGTLAMRLLRPVHPLWAYAAASLGGMPLRFVVSLPIAVIALLVVGQRGVTHDPVLWIVWAASVAGAWLITLLVNLAVGCASFFVESSLKLMDAWLVSYFVFSGYMIPIDLFPPALRIAIQWLPFRFQLGLPVEIMTGAHDRTGALALLGVQWIWVAVALGTTAVMWRAGLRRFSAYGG